MHLGVVQENATPSPLTPFLRSSVSKMQKNLGRGRGCIGERNKVGPRNGGTGRGSLIFFSRRGAGGAEGEFGAAAVRSLRYAFCVILREAFVNLRALRGEKSQSLPSLSCDAAATPPSLLTLQLSHCTATANRTQLTPPPGIHLPRNTILERNSCGTHPPDPPGENPPPPRYSGRDPAAPVASQRWRR